MFADITLAVNEVAEALGKKKKILSIWQISTRSSDFPESGSMPSI